MASGCSGRPYEYHLLSLEHYIARAATRSVAGTAGVRLPRQFEGNPRALTSDLDRPKAW